jgi:hypothetical protein
MTLFKNLTLAAVLMTSPYALYAQQAEERIDYDGAAACAVIYQQIAGLYTDRGEDEKAAGFRNTSTAYSAVALHLLSYQNPDPQWAQTYAEDRMLIVVDGLNQASSDNSDGDSGVVSQWLPWCDSMGDQINRGLKSREANGW